MIRSLYDWVIRLAGHRRAIPAMGVVSFLESSFFPIPPDVMLVPMVLANRDKAFRIALVCTVFAFGFHIHLLRRMSAYTANLAMNFEPIYGILAAALLFGEHKQVHPLFYAGLATILAANILHPFCLRRLNKPL